MAAKMYYRVDFYEGPIKDKKIVFSLEPSTVPFAFAVDDFVDSSGWTDNPLPPQQHYQITAVEHQLTFFGADECQHNVAISVDAIAR
jgi:hypothetical protein